MKKYLSFLFGFAFLFSFIITPLTSSALKAPDLEDVAPVESSCIDLKYNLKHRDRDANTNGEVSLLQDFLQEKGYFKNEPTGYFGILTRQAVAAFQKANNISPAVGNIGSVTRAKIKSLTCGDLSGPICDYAPPPTNCEYVKGPNYNSQTLCGMVLKCNDDTPSITVLSPNGGEVYQADQQITVKWKTDNIPTGLVPSIILDDRRENSIGGLVLGHNLLNDGTEIVTLPNSSIWTDMKYGTFYRIRVAFNKGDVAGSGFVYNDDSDNLFTINPNNASCPQGTTGIYPNCINILKPTITVTSPNGGESWNVGSTQKITWSAKYTPEGSWVALFLENSKNQRQLLAQKLPVNGSYSHSVSDTFCSGDVCYPDPIDGYYKIIARVYTGEKDLCGGFCLYDPKPEPVLITEDSSDSVFKINTPYQPCPTGTTGTYPNCVNTSPKITFSGYVSKIGSDGKIIATIVSNAGNISVNSGDDVNLVWNSTYSTTCQASSNTNNNDWKGVLDISGTGANNSFINGTKLVKNVTVPTIFTISCTGPGGQTTTQLDLKIIPKPTIPSVKILANPTNVQQNGTTALTWSSADATSCTASSFPVNANWTGGKQLLNGSQIISNITNPTIYTLTCTGIGGTTTVKTEVNVYVVDPAPVCPTGTTGTPPNCVTNPTYPSGCTSSVGYSTTTGLSCSTAASVIPRIAYWWGKVNQHIDANGAWQTDPSGTSGASIDKLTYCKKLYPTTTSVRDYKSEKIDTWREAYNIGPYHSATVVTTECVGGQILGDSIEKNPNLCSLDSTLMKGMKSPKVKCLQQKLNQKGYKVVGTEGGKEHIQFGYNTMLALKKFQAENDLKVDGILGLQTREVLNN